MALRSAERGEPPPNTKPGAGPLHRAPGESHSLPTNQPQVVRLCWDPSGGERRTEAFQSLRAARLRRRPLQSLPRTFPQRRGGFQGSGSDSPRPRGSGPQGTGPPEPSGSSGLWDRGPGRCSMRHQACSLSSKIFNEEKFSKYIPSLVSESSPELGTAGDSWREA